MLGAVWLYFPPAKRSGAIVAACAAFQPRDAGPDRECRIILNIVCMKWGTKYGPHYVNRLYAGVRRWLDRDVRFLCFTDDATGIAPGVEIHDLPQDPFEAAIVAGMTRAGRRGAWRKVSLFRPGLAGMQGPVLGFDLDVVITGPLDPLVDHAPGKVVMRREWRYEWRRKDGGHGSVFRFDPDQHDFLYNDFAADPEGAITRHKGSEQYYTSMTALRHGALAYLPGDLVCSFKRNAIPTFPLNWLVTPRLPENCRVLCFHGRPLMEEAIEGYSGSIRNHCRPTPWLADIWGDES
jgi:hypothetical protein